MMRPEEKYITSLIKYAKKVNVYVVISAKRKTSLIIFIHIKIQSYT